MLRFIPANVTSILDVGCSTGAFGREVRQRIRSGRLVGVEPNSVAASEALSAFDAVHVGMFPDVAGELGSELFDVIFFNDVLEHMPQPENALKAASKLLAHGGVVVASIPNVRHISVLGPLLLQGDFRYRESGILDQTHLRFFTKKTIRRLFADSGWTVDRLEAINPGLRVGTLSTPLWIRALSFATLRRTDEFFAVQFVSVARFATKSA